MSLTVKFEPRDVWIGVFWDKRRDGLHVYACPVPTVVIHWHRKRKGCGRCMACYPEWRGMYLCATCGNKRCPHATDCRHVCTGSNERGGSMLGFADDPSTPTIRETVRDIRDAITGARPCCHSTGPNHHPACQEKP